MKRIIPTGLLVAALVCLFMVTGQAGTYVSSNGKFYITYPDYWYQIDYNLSLIHI